MFIIGTDTPDLFGTHYNDVLIAGNDSNFLYGGRGNDTLVGRGYFTDMTGGKGADLFVPDVSFDAWTFIEDFQHGIDKITVPKGSHPYYAAEAELLYVHGRPVAQIETHGHTAHVTHSDFLFV